ncbi:MAG: hypothetical protein DMG70_16605 [Acidobacteria bacterium]|nr:MAG: hypothetical protein DMG70_16605 [Acidobacteriota bacterium]
MRFFLNLLPLGALLTSLLAFAQQPQPSQPVDPTQQAPATPPQQSTPPTFPPTAKQPPDESQPNSTETSQDTSRTFMGTIIRNRGSYLLRTGDKEYKLDDQSKAQKYAGKDVKVLGRLDKQNNVLHVVNIEIHPSM